MVESIQVEKSAEKSKTHLVSLLELVNRIRLLIKFNFGELVVLLAQLELQMHYTCLKLIVFTEF